MAWLVVAVILSLGAITWWRLRQRWIKPWQELEELVTAIVERQAPRKFLMTANQRANKLGLALETFDARQRQLERSATLDTRTLHSLLGAMPDGLALVDRQRRIQVTNSRFASLFGFASELGGIGLLEITRDAAIDRAVNASLDTGQVRTDPMTIARGVDSRWELEVTSVPFATGSTGPTHAVVLFRDVTELRRVEEMRRDFVANVSHELRTPLSIFRGYLETLLDDPEQSREEIVRMLEVMDRHAERLTLLVEDILSLAEIENHRTALDISEIDLAEFLAGTLADWEKRIAAKSLRAILEVPDDLPPLPADEHRLQEVIYNLLDNAVKYSDEGGSIRLTAQREDASIHISVADEGVGIPAHDLPRIFERFYRADKARSRQVGGTGLGLSIVKHIVQLHGGRVEASSKLGRGTTISVILPLERAAPATEPTGAIVTQS